MRDQGVRSLVIYCLNPKRLHRSVLNVDSYPASALVQSFGPKMVYAKCGMIGADARPNWKEASPVTDWRGRAASGSDTA
jgi:hypothetical protein